MLHEDVLKLLPPEVQGCSPVIRVAAGGGDDNLVIYLTDCPKVIEKTIDVTRLSQAISRRSNLVVRVTVGPEPTVEQPENEKKRLNFMAREGNFNLDREAGVLTFDRRGPNSKSHNAAARYTSREFDILESASVLSIWYVSLIKSTYPNWILTGWNPPNGAVFDRMLEKV